MDKKTGVYICTGCEIGDALDIEKLSKISERSKPAFVKTHPFLCGEEGICQIRKDIGAEELDSTVIAACSPRVKSELFEFSPTLVERVNLREQVAWVHEPGHEDTQMLAEDLMRMGHTKLKKTEAPVPYTLEDLSSTVLVVGGGVAGLTAAVESAQAGYKVILLEKESQLGGYVAKMHKVAPSRPPYRELEDSGVSELIAEVQENPEIKVFTSATIEKVAGGPGLFDTHINSGGSTQVERVGAIVLAAGSNPYDAEKLSHLGYGNVQNVITRESLEEMAVSGKITRPSDGGEVKSVAFLQCAGSRGTEHLPYCSASCCSDSLRQAIYLKEQNPEIDVYVIYRDIRTPGQAEEFYRRAQNEGIIFIKGDFSGIGADENGIALEIDDVMAEAKATLNGLDLVVLATGMVPVTAVDSELGETEEAAPAEESDIPESDSTGPIVKSNILNLEYRQGPELPALRHGFPDSHFICFPYETRRTGIYAAGSVRRPMGVSESVEDAVGAALKAIQCIESTINGAAVHPRVGDLSYPEFFMQRCTQCKRCTDECPFGAINEDEKSSPILNPTRCRRCGTCMGCCPEKLISFKNYSVDMIGSMLKSIDVPEEDEEKPRILAFVCENDAYPAIDMAGFNRLSYSPYIRIIPVRCLGSVNLVWIADALSNGIDGIILLGCKHGDDYQCHFVKGSELANYRLSKVSETLDRLSLEPERVRQEEVAITDYHRIPKLFEDYMEVIEDIGPNPYKDF